MKVTRVSPVALSCCTEHPRVAHKHPYRAGEQRGLPISGSDLRSRHRELQVQLGWWDLTAPWWQLHHQARLDWNKWQDSRRHSTLIAFTKLLGSFRLLHLYHEPRLEREAREDGQVRAADKEWCYSFRRHLHGLSKMQIGSVLDGTKHTLTLIIFPAPGI